MEGNLKLFAEIKNAFPKMEKLFDESTLADFLNCPYEDLDKYHFGLGLWVRNNLLQPSEILYEQFQQGGVFQKDDMSALIIQLFYITFRQKRSTFAKSLV